MPMTFDPMWKTMKEKGFTTYTLRVKMKMGGGTYNRIKANMSVSTNTIEALCEYMDCNVQDIIEYKKEGS